MVKLFVVEALPPNDQEPPTPSKVRLWKDEVPVMLPDKVLPPPVPDMVTVLVVLRKMPLFT